MRTRGYFWSTLAVLLGCAAPAPVSPGPARSAAVTDRDARSAAVTDRDARSAAVTDRDARSDHVTLFMLGEVHGKPEPCGCQTEPLGDVARVAGLVRRAGPRALLLDAGGLRYDAAPPTDEHRPEARLKAEFLERTWADLGALVGLRPEDLQDGVAGLAGTRRLAANVQGVPGLLPWTVRQLGPIRIGVTAVAPVNDPVAWPQGISASAPLPAAQEAVDRLRREGAQVVVVLTGLPRTEARALTQRLKGADLVLTGGELGEFGVDDPESIGDSLLLTPAHEGMALVQVDLYLNRGAAGAPPKLVLFQGSAAQAREVARLRRRIERLRDQLAGLRAARDADPAFLRSTAADLQEAEAALRAAQRPQTPPAGPYVTVELVKVRRALARDPQVERAMAALDQRIGEDNLRRATPPPPVAEGEAGYSGGAACVGCHEDAVEFWRKTNHAHAWRTLVEVKKQRSYDCMGCHATGLGEPGGTSLLALSRWDQATSKGARPGAESGPDLRDVGCESCHGPAGLHLTQPMKIAPPRALPGEGVCLQCHTRAHSDTFAFEPYLRDILGPGHGATRRERLGPGPTGHELRAAGLLRAAKSGGHAP